MGQPLDNQTATFYGQFVQAAYTMFANNNADPLRPEPDGIPNRYELGAWIHMSDFILFSKEPKFYGIVVHNLDNPDSRIIASREPKARPSGSTMRFAAWFPFPRFLRRVS